MRPPRALPVALVALLALSLVPGASAHDWQTTATDGPMELGVSSTPRTPVAGINAEFSARIADDQPENDVNRLSWGGVTNTSLEIHIRGPGGYHDHVAAEVPPEDAHFHWTYMFPMNGTFTITVEFETENETFELSFERTVLLLPADARGEKLDQTSEQVQNLSEQVQDLSEQVDQLKEELRTHNETASQERADAPGLTAPAAALVLFMVAYARVKRRDGA